MKKTLRIGTRDSELALWQARKVQSLLEALGYPTTLVPVKSQGDLTLDIPLYTMGITGVFTKVLDVAMLQGVIDIAVHSMKDVPTTLPKGIIKGAILKRANVQDVLVYKENLDFLSHTHATIATGSLRRKAQWLRRFPTHLVENLRGNINTRLEKLHKSPWQGAIFAAAALERLDKKEVNAFPLDWMTPAPAQGAIMVVSKAEDTYTKEALALINDQPTDIETNIERRFLKRLEGGCTAPIGAKATLDGKTISFVGNLFSLDGKHAIEVKKTISLDDIENFPEACADEILLKGGADLMQEIRKVMNIQK
ncbi:MULTISPECIES: hydroxymethylbilane synthase [unclassified Capnocytophaga]|jgi:porphobilinogen deaminase|uniref:hydroxymethylbilane synthase n=1 Tax=unclassified Capnocytophaga TaxID=2640652 RepID=UPI000202E4E0|nr:MULTISPECIES: hydroxymethylbilane synthase [unclassified Capnocytophaga]EGD33774.1 hydroxymethylbilane synthase [Capnocytophaga sp. oral taxon 338 str. F0234]MEB3005481.1 hydroxymethylbilane synthase [Capnocytophaga sp. G2]